MNFHLVKKLFAAETDEIDTFGECIEFNNV